jgi:hypothetical protein
VEGSPDATNDATNENLIDMTCAASLINKVFDLGWKLSGTALKRGPIDLVFTKELCLGEKRFFHLYWQVEKVAKKVINCQDSRSVNIIIIVTALLSKGARSNTSPLVFVKELEEWTTLRGPSKDANPQEETVTEASNLIKSSDVNSKCHALI